LLVPAFISLSVGSIVVPAHGQSAGQRSTRDGVYSELQAERGRRSFETHCTECHELAEFTGVGAILAEREGERLWEIFDFMWSEMPEDRPSWLEPDEYADILAFLLSAYGLPAGSEALPADRSLLRSVRLNRPEPPGS
jgi:mono/diheme cytochrome c family protein